MSKKKDDDDSLSGKNKKIETDDINLSLLRGRIYERNLKILQLYQLQVEDMIDFHNLVCDNEYREDVNSFIVNIKDAFGLT
jgi:DNA-nicking Smr family endonuclease|tara:strand:- start:358 stop:600 length:243 start_codon:yes stop_codon:yes gene_type:complete